jgi:hypothetical protein
MTSSERNFEGELAQPAEVSKALGFINESAFEQWNRLRDGTRLEALEWLMAEVVNLREKVLWLERHHGEEIRIR